MNIGCGDGVQALVYDGDFKRMVGLDINPDSINTARTLAEYYNISQAEFIQGNVEQIKITEKFDKAIAIDIIEHVINPDKMIMEIHRLLRDQGELLITFPAMHDKWENLFRFIGRRIFRRKGKTKVNENWDPDVHQHDYSIRTWRNLIEAGGFKLIVCRASTMFPPLHYLGLPKFWFSNKLIHTIDSLFCNLPVIKNYGQRWYRYRSPGVF